MSGIVLRHRPAAGRLRAEAVLVAVTAVLAAAVAAAVATSGLLALLVIGAVVVGLILGVRADALLLLALVSTAAEPEYIFGIPTVPAVTKAVLIVAGGLLVTRWGLNWRHCLPLVAYAVVLSWTLLRPPGVADFTAGVALSAFLGFAAYWLTPGLRMPDSTARAVLRIVTLLPALSVLSNLLLFEPLAGYPTLFSEYASGVTRLQGAVVPAHLAFLALAGTFGTLLALDLRIARARHAVPLLIVNVLILAATLTRTSLLALAILLLPALWRLIRHRDVFARYVMVTVITAVVAAAWFVVLGPELQARSMTSASGGQFDTSGRTEAWAFYLNAARGHEWTGLGLGAATVVTRYSAEFSQYFPVPHNEYIRAYVDGGWIGLVLLLLALVLSGRYLISAVAPACRPTVRALMVATLVLAITDNAFSTVQYLVPLGLALSAAVSLHQPVHRHGADRRVVVASPDGAPPTPLQVHSGGRPRQLVTSTLEPPARREPGRSLPPARAPRRSSAR